MPIPTTSTYLMADRLTGGTLAEQLDRYRRAGVAWAAIARLLRQDHGVEAFPDTLKGWAIELGLESEPEPAK